MNKLKIIPLFLFIALTHAGCMKDEQIPISSVDLYGSRGVFIVNEGNYLYGNGSLSYYDFESRQVINNIYSIANGVPLGDVAYSMTIYDGKAYIVVNNSSSIQVVDANTLLHAGTITGLPSPRHIHFINNELALVSDLYARGISIVNPKTLSTIGKINTGNSDLPFFQHSTEKLIRIGNNIYTNTWSFDNKILIINTQTLSLVDSIEVGIQPLDMALDKNNNLWVIHDGGYAGNPFGQENPSLVRINTESNTVELRIDFPLVDALTGQLATNPTGDSVYFICNDLYKMHVNSESIPETPTIERNGRNLRALGVDPNSGEIYLSDATDFMSEGKVYRYKSNGLPIDTIEVGIIPGFFCFN